MGLKCASVPSLRRSVSGAEPCPVSIEKQWQALEHIERFVLRCFRGRKRPVMIKTLFTLGRAEGYTPEQIRQATSSLLYCGHLVHTATWKFQLPERTQRV